MSEETGWMVTALIATVVLSGGFVAWHTYRLRRHAAADSDQARPFWQKQPMLVGLMALGLAGLAQFALQTNQSVLAAASFWFAVILFAGAMRQFIPVTGLVETPAPTTVPEPGSAALASAVVGAAVLTHETASKVAVSAAHQPADTIEPGSAPAANSLGATLALGKIALSASADVEKPPVESAVVRVWTGFGRPQGLGVTTAGNLLVLDGARQRVYCLDSGGAIIREWALPEIPELQDYSAAFSPDGQQLYLTDPAQGQVYAVTLK